MAIYTCIYVHIYTNIRIYTLSSKSGGFQAVAWYKHMRDENSTAGSPEDVEALRKEKQEKQGDFEDYDKLPVVPRTRRSSGKKSEVALKLMINFQYKC